MDDRLLRTKPLDQLAGPPASARRLPRTLSSTDLTLVGVGATIGTGIFMLTGTAAAHVAGPGIVLSYVAAGFACLLAALCYAELAAMMPVSGSAYSHTYAAVGEIAAWFVGWDLVLEYGVGAVTVAMGWSGYLQRLLAGLGLSLPTWMTASYTAETGALVNLPAMLVVFAMMPLLVAGLRGTLRVNAALVAVKLVAILVFAVAGVGYVQPSNWTPFLPYGVSGVMTGSAVVFTAYIGFDAVSTMAEEAANPGRDLPIGILAACGVCVVLYVAVALLLTGLVPVTLLTRDAQFLGAPARYAVQYATGSNWAAGLLEIGAIAGMTNVLLVMLIGQPRVLFAMGRDGLLPGAAARIHARHRTPYVTTVLTCTLVSIAAGVMPIAMVAELTTIGTLFAFAAVSVSVIALRVRRPDAARPFRLPFGWVIPVLSLLVAAVLMVRLPALTWLCFLAWLDFGIIVYWFYGRRHSRLADRTAAGNQSGMLALPVLGGALAANGVAMTLLASLTRWHVIDESQARWRELERALSRVGLHVTPETAAVAGLTVLAGGAVVGTLGFRRGRLARS